jgi:hypothetical protein
MKIGGNRKSLEDRTTGQDRVGGGAQVKAPLENARAAARSWLVLGIDPGEQGAVALILAHAGCDRPQLGELVNASDRRAVRRLVAEADLVVLEGQQASPQMGVSSAFGLGRAYGALQEVVEAGARGEVVVAYPAGWRGSYGLVGGKEGKVDGIRLAGELLRSRYAVRRHDQADAVLLAWWGWRHKLLARAVQALQGAGSS